MTETLTPNRDFDVVLYGATGFTGRQAAAYLANHAPRDLRWAIAGRDASRLEAVAQASTPAAGATPPVLVVDSTDAAAVAAMAARTRVLATTVGPYARYGTPVVQACVAAGTHYTDITGETAWVRDLVDRFHDQAAHDGTRIVPFCGFDSVPSDLGALIAVRHLRDVHGVGTKRVEAFHRGRGGVNGGTLASMLEMLDSGARSAMRDPILLNPPGMRGGDRPEAEPDPLLPSRNADLGVLGAPFVMGPINTRVVRRSACLAEQDQAPYGGGFRYQEYWRCEGPLDPLEAAAFTWSELAVGTLANVAPLRRGLARLLPPPGSGPSEASMDGGFFSTQLVARAEDGRRIGVEISDRGDPGNRATVKMLCESTLALALDTDDLPGGARRGGILTPASAIGLRLRERLEAAGMRIEITDPLN